MKYLTEKDHKLLRQATDLYPHQYQKVFNLIPKAQSEQARERLSEIANNFLRHHRTQMSLVE
jgi:hypothetical protein